MLERLYQSRLNIIDLVLDNQDSVHSPSLSVQGVDLFTKHASRIERTGLNELKNLLKEKRELDTIVSHPFAFFAFPFEEVGTNQVIDSDTHCSWCRSSRQNGGPTDRSDCQNHRLAGPCQSDDFVLLCSAP